MPPLMKLWLDEVFSLRLGLRAGRPRAAAARTSGWSLPLAGPKSPTGQDGHNRYAFDAFLPPYEQTAALTGMRWLPPLLLHGAHRVGDAELARHARLFAERLASHPRWSEIDRLEPAFECEVPADARPPDPP
jgi:glutathione-regulated potassium-efflux system ancillary protein KefF